MSLRQNIVDNLECWPCCADPPDFPQAAPPSKGDATMTLRANGYSGGAFQYQQVGKVVYDPYGRVVKQYDGRDNAATMDYTTSAIGLTTGEVVTDPRGDTTTTTYDPARALTLTATDPNGDLPPVAWRPDLKG